MDEEENNDETTELVLDAVLAIASVLLDLYDEDLEDDLPLPN